MVLYLPVSFVSVCQFLFLWLTSSGTSYMVLPSLSIHHLFVHLFVRPVSFEQIGFCLNSSPACVKWNEINVETRKHRQSYRHADPRRQRPQAAQRRIGIPYGIPSMVTSNRATVTIFVPCDLDLWPFDLWVNACRATAIEYTGTKFGVDSLSRFSVRARTDRQTRLDALPTLAAMPAWETRRMSATTGTVCGWQEYRCSTWVDVATKSKNVKVGFL